MTRWPSPRRLSRCSTFIAGRSGLHVARLYTITLFGGGQLCVTDADFDIKGNSTSPLVNGFSYSSGAVRVDQKESKTQAHLKIGTDTGPYSSRSAPRPISLKADILPVS